MRILHLKNYHHKMQKGLQYKSLKDSLDIDVKLSTKEDKECSESVLQVVMSRNTDIFDKIKEVPTMIEALAQLMKPEIDKMIAEREAEATARVNAEKDAVIAQKEAENKKALEYIKELEAKLALAKV